MNEYDIVAQRGGTSRFDGEGSWYPFDVTFREGTDFEFETNTEDLDSLGLVAF